MMDIVVKTIPHSTQRYPTVGDWYFDNELEPRILFIMVSDMGDIFYEYLVARHEQDEAMLCLKRGITEKAVSDFDISFEASRFEGNIEEPGDSPKAPYHKEHVFATLAEKAMANELRIDWEEYDNAVNAL